MTAAIYVLALGAAILSLGAMRGVLAFSLGLTPRQVYEAYRRWYRKPCVVVRFQDRRS